MLIYEYKLDGSMQQEAAIDEAIRIVQFIRNKCLRLWMDERGAVLDRDHNAALNILAKALERTLGHRETSGSPENASGQETATALSVMAGQQVTWMKEEPPAF